MLKWRVITASLLAPCLIAVIWLLPTVVVSLLFGLVLALCGWEWARLVGLGSVAQRGYVLGLAVLISLGWVYYQQNGQYLPMVFVLSTVWWLGLLNRLLKFNRAPRQASSPVLAGVEGYLLLWPTWAALVYLHGLPDGGPALLTMLLFAVWGADTGAYFAGRAFGRRKLAPNISPGKTWEGVAGGVALALVTSVVLHLWLAPAWFPIYVMLPLMAVVVLFSIAGDLYESMIKRQHGAKDSGAILPGHGGLLDRLDSITAAAPIFVMGLLWWRYTL